MTVNGLRVLLDDELVPPRLGLLALSSSGLPTKVDIPPWINSPASAKFPDRRIRRLGTHKHMTRCSVAQPYTAYQTHAADTVADLNQETQAVGIP
jgi:hypothetical protein